jgi:hypothetical protein
MELTILAIRLCRTARLPKGLTETSPANTNATTNATTTACSNEVPRPGEYEAHNTGAHCSPPYWLEVIHLAKTLLELFTVAQAQGVPPVCIFKTRGWKCTISENNWRSILSGATDLFLSTLKDEHAEVMAIDLIQLRLNHLKDSSTQPNSQKVL